MKKKLFALVVTLLSVNLFACDDGEREIVEFSLLPQEAQTFVNTHFSDKQVSVVFHDKEVGDHDYEVIFTDSASIDFDKKGRWTEVEDRDVDGVPVAIYPESIVAYLNAHHAGSRVVKVNKDKRDYEVELSNDIDLVFDLDGKFLRYDD